MKSPFLLMIIDGFGYSEETEHNAIASAETPNWDKLWQNCPRTLIDCSGQKVGLPDGQMGNSEVGHMNIGSGRIIYQDLTRIDNSIDTIDTQDDNSFFQNPVLLDLISNQSNKPNQALHVLGLVSNGGVHSHLRHYMALAKLAKKHDFNNLYVHAFLDGRDTPPKSALDSLLELNNYLEANNIGKIVSLIGRFYAMDRDKRLERTILAYELLINSTNEYYMAPDIKSALEQAYAREETDEFVQPTLIANSKQDYEHYKVKDGDNVIFMNFRADRARQLSYFFTNHNNICIEQNITPLQLNRFVTLTEYDTNLTEYVAYKPEKITNTLGEFLQNQNATQLRIAETEKYAHVTFFFNGGREEPFTNEERVLIPSPKVKTYDLKPEMSAYELTEELCKHIESGKYDAIICNYANPDMVGHTGSLPATIKAIETIDNCLENIIKSINRTNGKMFITADHGNAECMYNPETKQPHTAHTNSLVPLVYYDANNKSVVNILKTASLCDIAPSMLHLMGYDAPKEMTGKIIFTYPK